MPHRNLLTVLLLLLSAGALLGGATETRAQGSAPTVTLLSPANGSTVVNHLGTDYPTFRWRITWDGAPTPATIVYTVEYATNAAFSDAQAFSNFSCRTEAIAECSSSIRPHDAWARRKGAWHWRIRIIAPVALTSAASSFRAVPPPDRDRDGVLDREDNCPSVRNPRQEDYESDRKGDACQPDRTAPRVRALKGNGFRGRTAYFLVQSRDNRGYVRLRLEVMYRGRRILHGAAPFMVRNWGEEVFSSKQTISRSLPTGTYRFCATAWDKSGNRAKSCAPYLLQ